MNDKSRSIGAHLVILGLAAILLLAQPGVAGNTQVETELSAFRVIARQNGEEDLKPAERASPGDVIEYKLVCTNKGTEPADNLQPTLPIPPETEYLPGSAKPVDVLASLDGKSFALVPLRYMVKGTDGKIREEEIPYREYRFLQWRLGRLEPGDGIVVKARVRIATNAAPNK